MISAADLWFYAFLLLYLGFFAGYCVGRRLGVREGVERGRHLAPLELRRLTCLKGACVLCGTPANINGTNFSPESAISDTVEGTT